MSASNVISSSLVLFFAFSATSHGPVALELYKFICIFPFEDSLFSCNILITLLV